MDGINTPIAGTTSFLAGAYAEAVQANHTPLQLLDPRQWTDPAPRRGWVLEDWIPRGSTTLLYGDGGQGKTLIAQQLLTSVALALPWLGLHPAAGRALGVFCEDEPAELQRRQEAINAALGVDASALENLRMVSCVGNDNALMVFPDGETGQLTPFWHKLDEASRKLRPSLIVLDTAADLFAGNENHRGQVRQFIQHACGRLARNHHCGVLLLAHPSAAGLSNGSGTGGSTAWNNSARSRLYLDRVSADEGDPDARVLSRRKSNYAATGEKLRIRWHAGCFVADAPETSASGDPSWETIAAIFAEIAAAWERGNPWSPSKQTRRAGRWLPAWMREQHGIPLERGEKLLSGWLMHGFLDCEQCNAKSKKTGLRVVRQLTPEAYPPAR